MTLFYPYYQMLDGTVTRINPVEAPDIMTALAIVRGDKGRHACVGITTHPDNIPNPETKWQEPFNIMTRQFHTLFKRPPPGLQEEVEVIDSEDEEVF